MYYVHLFEFNNKNQSIFKKEVWLYLDHYQCDSSHKNMWQYYYGIIFQIGVKKIVISHFNSNVVNNYSKQLTQTMKQ